MTKRLKACIGPSILNADLSNLANECRSLILDGSDYLHLDMMDGHFVPQVTIGPPVITSLSDALKTDKPYFDTHLMVSNPSNFVMPLKEAGTDRFTFHIETVDSTECTELIKAINRSGMHVGIAVNPSTDITVVEPFISDADVILVMTVVPGKGGQRLIPECLEKVKYLRKKYPNLNIQVDGGVGPSTIKECAEAGANIVVSGTALLKSENRSNAIQFMRNTITDCLHE